jgi:hypothetical protein
MLGLVLGEVDDRGAGGVCCTETTPFLALVFDS